MMRSFRSRSPCSDSCVASVAVKVFVMEQIGKVVSAVTGCGVLVFVTPIPAA